MTIGGPLPRADGAIARVADPLNDAPPQYDVTGVRYEHSSARVSAVARLPELGRRGKAQLAITHFTVFEAGYIGQLSKRPGAAPRVQLFYFDHFDSSPRKCPGIEGTWGEGRIQIFVPKACMGQEVQQAERVFVQFTAGIGGEFDSAPAVRRLQED